MIKLPFVWELEYGGVVSHAIGTKHRVFSIYDRQSIKPYLMGKEIALFELMDSIPQNEFPPDEHIQKVRSLVDKLNTGQTLDIDECQLFRNELFIGQALDWCIADVCYESNIPIQSLETQDERRENDLDSAYSAMPSLSPEKQYEQRIKLDQFYMEGWLDHMASSFKEYEARKRKYFTASQYSADLNRNRIMAERALPHLRTAPTLVAIGVAHYIVPGNILERWEKEGVKIKRIE